MAPADGQDGPREIADVNVVPLADVSLCLLIILMVISPMMTQEMLKVQAAAVAKAGAPPAPEPAAPDLVLVVRLTRDGISVGERAFDGIGPFMSFMAAALAPRLDRKVFLAPDPDVVNGRVVHMIELLRSCGASSVALVETGPEAGPG